MTTLAELDNHPYRYFSTFDVSSWVEEWLAIVGRFPDPETWAAWNPPEDPTSRFGWESANHVVLVWWPTEGTRDEKATGVYMSFKRRDKAPIGDWRLKQRLKNAILGDEAEGCELFPAESRLIDESNQYHMFCMLPPHRLGFGFKNRTVLDGDGLSDHGLHRQRPLSDQGGPL